MRKYVRERTDKTQAENDTDASTLRVIFRMRFLYVSISGQQRNDFDAEAGVEFACNDDHVILQEGIFMQISVRPTRCNKW